MLPGRYQAVGTAVGCIKRWLALPDVSGLKFGIPFFFRNGFLRLWHNGLVLSLRMGEHWQADKLRQQEAGEARFGMFKHGHSGFVGKLLRNQGGQTADR